MLCACQPYGQCHLQQQDEGNAIAEFQVSAFVPHDEDGDHRAYRTAYGCQGEERELGDAPHMTLGLDLVDPVDRRQRGPVVPADLDAPGIIDCLAKAKVNILTINQNYPINGLADISVVADTSSCTIEISQLMMQLARIRGVREQNVLARGKAGEQ